MPGKRGAGVDRRKGRGGTTTASAGGSKGKAGTKNPPIQVDRAQVPPFCDYSCRHADFPPEDTVGACRRELAVWCTALARFNNKNNRCLLRA